MRVDILGPLRVTDNEGDPVPLTPPKLRALLTILALSPDSPVSRDHIMDALWAEDPPDSANKTVNGYVKDLNKKLAGVTGHKPVVFTGGGYMLSIDPGHVDFTRFEQLLKDCEAARTAEMWRECVERGRAALALWRGAPLEDLHEDRRLSRGVATRFSEMRDNGEELVFSAMLELGEHQSIIGELQAAVIDRPDSERLRRQLMLSLFRSNRDPEAEAQGREYWRRLEERGLGAPNQAFREFENLVICGDEGLRKSASSNSNGHSRAGRQRSLHGNVTFVYSDVDGSELLASELGDDRYPALLEREQQAVRNALANYGGEMSDLVGGSLVGKFDDASKAVQACLEAQQSIVEVGFPKDAPIRARMGVITCITRPDSDDDEWTAMHQAALICGAAHGGQILLSAGTAEMVRRYLPPGASLSDRGPFVLGGFDESEHLHQVMHPSLESSFPPLRASPAQSHNLPDIRSSFKGREADVDMLSSYLRSTRLVTVVGTGGVGKTRLAVETAARLAADYDSGVRLCDLTSVETGDLVPAAIAMAFGVGGATGSEDALTKLAARVGRGRALLLLDGCEAVGLAACDAVWRLMQAAPGLTVLATSREALGMEGEQLLPLAPIGVPDERDDLATVQRSEAVELFEDRVRLVQPGFEVSESTFRAVAAICRYLGGLPLALEIVAPQMASLPAREIASRLEGGRPLPERGSVPGRHRSLESTINWSYQLLDDQGQRLLRYLSVFANGFTVGAADSVSDAPDPTIVLSRLVDKSLVLHDPDASRYRMLEPIRAFARERLQAAGEVEEARRRHLEFFADYVERLDSDDSGARSLELLHRDWDNFRTALAFAASRKSPERGALTSAVSDPQPLPGGQGEAPVEQEWAWEAVVTADREHFARTEDGQREFPRDAPVRRFPLVVDNVRIGRRDGSGIVPEVDLAGPPTDDAVSHNHATLIRRGDGWELFDDVSYNGVFLAGREEPLEKGQLVPLLDGDRFSLGWWTTVTLHKVPLPKPPVVWSTTQ